MQEKHWIPLIVAALVIGFVAGAFLVRVSSEPLRVPLRPSTVPGDALWSGGADGGAWFLCYAHDDKRYECTVYADMTGDVVEQGVYALHGHSAIYNQVRPVMLVQPGTIEVRAWLVREH